MFEVGKRLVEEMSEIGKFTNKMILIIKMSEKLNIFQNQLTKKNQKINNNIKWKACSRKIEVPVIIAEPERDMQGNQGHLAGTTVL